MKWVEGDADGLSGAGKFSAVKIVGESAGCSMGLGFGGGCGGETNTGVPLPRVAHRGCLWPESHQRMMWLLESHGPNNTVLMHVSTWRSARATSPHTGNAFQVPIAVRPTGRGGFRLTRVAVKSTASDGTSLRPAGIASCVNS